MHVELPAQLAEFKDTRYGCIVTFDFEDTMTLPAFNPKLQTWEHSLEPNYAILAEIVRLTLAGYRCIAVSENNPTEYNKRRLHHFCLLYDLPIHSTIFTGGQEPVSFLVAAGSQMHYDDDPYVIFSLAEYDITGVMVPHPADTMTPDDYRTACDSWRMRQAS
jgi:hypothetical protein